MHSQLVIDSKKYIEKALSNLKKEWYLFHNIDHTLDVFDRAEYLIKKEWIIYKEGELILLASLFHDIWFLYSYDNNEKIAAKEMTKYANIYCETRESVKKAWVESLKNMWKSQSKMFFHDRLNYTDLVENYLVKNSFTCKHIDKIQKLILATVPLSKVHNKFEKIIVDADLDNLWRNDFFEKWDLLRQEILSIKWIKFTDLEWYKNINNFMHKVTLYTKTQINERWKKFNENKKTIKEKYEQLSNGSV